jgi:hypothetical protein
MEQDNDMGEPIQLHGTDGQTLNVYTRQQAEALLAGGEWYATAADAKAGKARPEPTPATDIKLEALEGDAGVVVEGDVTEAPAPRKVAKGKQGKL